MKLNCPQRVLSSNEACRRLPSSSRLHVGAEGKQGIIGLDRGQMQTAWPPVQNGLGALFHCAKRSLPRAMWPLYH